MPTYSFDLSRYELGQLIATRYPDNQRVDGDWVCTAEDDGDAECLARLAAGAEWALPETRHYQDFEIEFR